MSIASASLPKSISKQAPEVLPRASRARRFGIDCESELRWHAKEPGGDYKQKLLIKNVSNQVPRVAGAAHPVVLPPPCACVHLCVSPASWFNRSCGIARVHSTSAPMDRALVHYWTSVSARLASRSREARRRELGGGGARADRATLPNDAQRRGSACASVPGAADDYDGVHLDMPGAARLVHHSSTCAVAVSVQPHRSCGGRVTCRGGGAAAVLRVLCCLWCYCAPVPLCAALLPSLPSARGNPFCDMQSCRAFCKCASGYQIQVQPAADLFLFHELSGLGDAQSRHGCQVPSVHAHAPLPSCACNAHATPHAQMRVCVRACMEVRGRRERQFVVQPGSCRLARAD